VEIAKRRGFFWPSFSLYGGESGFYDFGPVGTLLKDRFLRLFRQSYLREGGIFIDTPTVTPKRVFQASGHLEKFEDLAVKCSRCGRYDRIDSSLKKSGIARETTTLEDAISLIDEGKLICAYCGGKIVSAEMMSQMFRVERGKGYEPYYLRPETAQGIFVNFKLLLNQNRGKLPMIVCQYGKGYRNEISPRQALLRQREFFMAEVEVFLDPEAGWTRDPPEDVVLTLLQNSGNKLRASAKNAHESGVIANRGMAYFIYITYSILRKCGIPEDGIRFRQHRKSELAHYARDAWDAEAVIDDDWVEIVGIADRGDYDLRKHSDFSGEPLSAEGGAVPVVVEPAYGVDRITMAVLSSSYYVRENGFKVMRLAPEISPYIVAVLPLQIRDGLDAIARELFAKLMNLNDYVAYDESGSIGRRYARQDEIGTPYCITVDYQTKEDSTVTIRERDSTSQIRVKIDDLTGYPILQNTKLMKELSALSLSASKK